MINSPYQRRFNNSVLADSWTKAIENLSTLQVTTYYFVSSKSFYISYVNFTKLFIASFADVRMCTFIPKHIKYKLNKTNVILIFYVMSRSVLLNMAVILYDIKYKNIYIYIKQNELFRKQIWFIVIFIVPMQWLYFKYSFSYASSII